LPRTRDRLGTGSAKHEREREREREREGEIEHARSVLSGGGMARDGRRRLDEIKRAFRQRGETREEGLPPDKSERERERENLS
jgi:hypothetical protein